MTPILSRAGFVIVGVKYKDFVESKEEIPEAVEKLLAKENEERGEDPLPGPLDKDDIYVMDVFTKTWRGAVLSENGKPNHTGDWDQEYAKLVLKEAVQGE